MSLKTTVFPAHAEADHGFTRQLADCLEFGCDVTCYTGEGLMRSDENLIAKAEEGLTADVIALLLSSASCPIRWRREEWEPVPFDQTRRANVELVPVSLGDCRLPELLRRRNFFEATIRRLIAMRLLKRWFWQRARTAARHPIQSSPKILKTYTQAWPMGRAQCKLSQRV